MERRTGVPLNANHADSSSALNMPQHLQGITSGHGGSSFSFASSTHLMSAPNPINNNGGSMANSSTIAVDDSSRGRKRRSLSEKDRYMPAANVVRIMRRALPGHARIAEDAKETLQGCVSEYISVVTEEANAICKREQRRTVTAEDVISGMRNLGFDNYAHCLSRYLARLRYHEHGITPQPTAPTETYRYAPPLPPMVASDKSPCFDYGPVPNPQGIHMDMDMDMDMMTLPRAATGPMMSNYFDYGPATNPQLQDMNVNMNMNMNLNMNMNMMTLPGAPAGPVMPNYGPGLEFQLGPNNSGMFDATGLLSGYYGNPLGDGPAGGSSSQNAAPNFDPRAQF